MRSLTFVYFSGEDIDAFIGRCISVSVFGDYGCVRGIMVSVWFIRDFVKHSERNEQDFVKGGIPIVVGNVIVDGEDNVVVLGEAGSVSFTAVLNFGRVVSMVEDVLFI